MWDKLRKQIGVELEQLDRLFEVHRPLLNKTREIPPNDIELSALAAFLHSFYTGIENIFKRVAVEVDGLPPQGESWHRELLASMAERAAARPPVISPDLGARLMEYLQFRHFFRHAYSFLLQWSKMRPLIAGCEDTLAKFRAEIESFLRHASPPG
ncbi:MAG: hypothetical protein LAO07_03850 [Acidobacteriia bacterium]|nr:hypothetical protein [Terriglobia bacterium]